MNGKQILNIAITLVAGIFLVTYLSGYRIKDNSRLESQLQNLKSQVQSLKQTVAKQQNKTKIQFKVDDIWGTVKKLTYLGYSFQIKDRHTISVKVDVKDVKDIIKEVEICRSLFSVCTIEKVFPLSLKIYVR